MKSVTVEKTLVLNSADLSFPGDKSLSHRAIIFGALAEGVSHFTNVLAGEDCVYTRKALEAMGVPIRSKGDSELWVTGRGLRSLRAPGTDLYLGNSGTSMRLFMGILAGQSFSATLTGDPSLSGRPMRRVVDPLRQMGAVIEGRNGGDFAPITVKGASLHGINYVMPVSSAQVKSAILLAGLYAEGCTRIQESEKSRDHTERFLKYFGATIEEKGLEVAVWPRPALKAQSFEIAGDISSAAFFMAVAALFPVSIRFRSVLWNPTRTGIAQILKRMGVEIQIDREYLQGPEPVADFSLRAGKLKAFEISKNELPLLIDEIPVLCVLATQAHGRSVIHDAKELRVKETDRILSMTELLTRMGAKIHSEGDTLIIEGPTALHAARLDSKKDHRTAMSGVVAALVAQGQTEVTDIDCINTSFPSFFELLKKLGVHFSLKGSG